jgi:hypothetical protein
LSGSWAAAYKQPAAPSRSRSDSPESSPCASATRFCSLPERSRSTTRTARSPGALSRPPVHTAGEQGLVAVTLHAALARPLLPRPCDSVDVTAEIEDHRQHQPAGLRELLRRSQASEWQRQLPRLARTAGATSAWRAGDAPGPCSRRTGRPWPRLRDRCSLRAGCGASLPQPNNGEIRTEHTTTSPSAD